MEKKSLYPTRFERDRVVSLRNRAILEILFAAGMRMSELIQLKIDQIDEAGRILIVGSDKTKRYLYLTRRAKKYLSSYLEIRGDTKSPYLFVPYRGRGTRSLDKKISPNYIQFKVKYYRERLGINMPVSARSFRYAFVEFLANSSRINLPAIQILLGHESLDTTTRYVRASHKYAEQSHKKFHPLKE